MLYIRSSGHCSPRPCTEVPIVSDIATGCILCIVYSVRLAYKPVWLSSLAVSLC